MTRTTLTVLTAVALLVVIAHPWTYADDAPSNTPTLEARIAAPEQRLAALESQLQPLLRAQRIEDTRAQARTAARQRMQQDTQKYSSEQLREVEQLYQVANKDWNSPQAVASLKALVEKYPDCNRTGCAVLYLGQMSDGEQKEQYLKQAITQFPDCFYGDGVQVGPYALWHLAHHYQRTNRPTDAAALFTQLREQYPHAIDHKGNLLADMMQPAPGNE